MPVRGRKKCNCLTPTNLSPLVVGAAILGAIIVGLGILSVYIPTPPPPPPPPPPDVTTSYYPVVVSPNIPYSNVSTGAFGYGTGVLSNPVVPPVKDSRYLVATSTDAVISDYRQVGMLTPQNGAKKDNLLPLMGRPLFARRGLWNYYAISNQNNAIKLPVTVKGKSGVTEYGVDELFNGDSVYVEGYDDVFRVSMYSNATIQYVPF